MSRLTCGHTQHMYSWWWVRLSPETCRVKPLRRIKTQLLHLFGLISLLSNGVWSTPWPDNICWGTSDQMVTSVDTTVPLLCSIRTALSLSELNRCVSATLSATDCTGAFGTTCARLWSVCSTAVRWISAVSGSWCHRDTYWGSHC